MPEMESFINNINGLLTVLEAGSFGVWGGSGSLIPRWRHAAAGKEGAVSSCGEMNPLPLALL